MNRLWRILPVLLLLVAQPAVPLVLSHGGNGDGHDSGGEHQGATAWKPNATRVTPDRRYVDQRNVDTSGPMIVWQERELGRDWDIVAKNLSTDGPAFPVTVDADAQTHPVIQGPWVAWVEHHEGNADIVVLNLRSGEQFQLPDTGEDDVGPTISHKTIYWLSRNNKNTGHLRGFDLVDRKLLYPIENKTIVAPPAAHGPFLTWAEGNNLEAKIRVQNMDTGETWSAPHLWTLKDGPAIGRWGVAFIADVHGTQSGTYTQLYNWTQGNIEAFRTGKYPHENVEVCDSGVLWDQYAPDVDNAPTVAIWDGFTDKIGDFGYDNHKADCTGDALLYEKVVPSEDEDLGQTHHLYMLNLASVRAPARATIEIDPGLERGIYEGKTLFTGDLILGDPREPLEGLWARIDGGELQPVRAQKTGEGTYRWRVEVDTSRYFNGQHSLNIISIDERGTQTQQGFVFFTHGTYQTSDEVFDQPLRVPIDRPSPFPFSIVDHYKDYQPFYNTVLLVIFLLVLIGYFVYRWVTHQPPAPPEYVPPESIDP